MEVRAPPGGNLTPSVAMSRSAYSAATSGGGAPSESVDLRIIPIGQRSIQSSSDPYDWSALRTQREEASLSQALPCNAPADVFLTPTLTQLPRPV